MFCNGRFLIEFNFFYEMGTFLALIVTIISVPKLQPWVSQIILTQPLLITLVLGIAIFVFYSSCNTVMIGKALGRSSSDMDWSWADGQNFRSIIWCFQGICSFSLYIL